MGAPGQSGTADPFGIVGQVLDGQFRVDRVVGEGGFSVVYKGHHLGLDEPIAVKCLKLPGALGSALVESFVRRFRDESRIHYRLSQGNLAIARSIASGTTMAPITGALVPYMVLEWLEGQSLAEDFQSRRAAGKTGRTLQEVVKLLDPAVDGVAYAHAQGVVHRDLNPGNFFLAKTREGTKLKVLDFGVAKIVSDHSLEMGPRAHTLGQIRIFSPAYGAPEQFDEQLGKVGPWTDVYALSLIILEALKDQTVNEGEHLGEFAMKAIDPDHRPTPRTLRIAVGDEVEALMASALALDPTARPQDAGELWGRMKHALREDADSGKAPHAHRPESLLPRPSAFDPDALPVSSPPVAVEVVRPARGGPTTRGLGIERPSDRPGTSTLRMSEAPSRAPSQKTGTTPIDISRSPLAVTPGVLVNDNHESATPPPVAATPPPPAPRAGALFAATPLPFASPAASTPPPGAFAPVPASLVAAAARVPRTDDVPFAGSPSGSMWIRSNPPPAASMPLSRQSIDVNAGSSMAAGSGLFAAAPAPAPIVLPRSKAPLYLLAALGLVVFLGAAAALVFYFVSLRRH